MVFSNSFPLVNCSASFVVRRSSSPQRGFRRLFLLQRQRSVRHQHVVVVLYLLNGRRFAETGFVFVLAVFPAPVMVRLGNELDIAVAQFLIPAVDHNAELAGVDKEDFIGAVAEFAVGFIRARNQRQAGIMVL